MTKITKNKVLTTLTKYPSAYIIITIVTFGIYFQTLSFSFIHFDDDLIIQNNLHNVNKFSASLVKEVFRRDAFFDRSPVYYRPLSVLSFVIIKVITGENPFYFHLTNLIFHIIFCCLLFYFLNLIKVRQNLSLILTLIFAIHPLFINTVVWIVEIDDLMAGIFLLSSFVMLIKYGNTKKISHLIYQNLFFLLALLSKETALIAPLVFILYLSGIKFKKLFELRNIILSSIWAVIIILYFLFRILVIGYQSNANLLYLFHNIPFIPEIISKFILPFNFLGLQSFNYLFVSIGVLVIAYLIYLLYKNRTKEISFWTLFGFLWFIIFSLPALFIISNTDKYGTHLYDYLECRAYIPMIGIFILMSVLINHYVILKKISYYGFLPIIILLGIINYKYAEPYSDPISFYTNIIENSTNPVVAYLNRGTYKKDLGDNAGAIEDLNKAIEIHPKFTEAYNSRGLIKKELGDLEGALTDYDKAIELNQTYDNPFNNRAIIKQEKDDFAGAIADLNRAIQLNPYNDVTYNNRGQAKEAYGDRNGAMYDFNKAIELNPNNFNAFNNRGNLRKELDDKNGAISDFDHVLAENSKNIEALINRGTLKNELGDKQGAISDYNLVLEIDPNNSTAYYNRGVIKYNLREIDDSWNDLNKAIELDPKDDKPYNNRAIIKLAKNDYKGALEDFNNALKLNPKNFYVYNNLGKFFIKGQDLQQALNCFGKAVAINPNFTEAIVNLGRTKSMMNDNEGAIEEWKKAAAQGSPEARELLNSNGR
jgi:tetratricopeptide (TPR) repeat protein